MTAAQPVFAGIVGAVTGFASSFALVIAGLRAVGASDAQAASGLLALCLGLGILAIVLSWRFRIPLSFAWSTPGAALLLAAAGEGVGFGEAVGAFLVCAALLLITGAWPALARLVMAIPRPIASAMLAGILFPICIAPVTAAIEVPLLALPVIAIWLLLARLAPRWAVPAAMLVAAVGIALTAGQGWLEAPLAVPRLEFVPPEFDAAVIASLGVPLYVVTMAGQNVPGFAVLTTFGYHRVPGALALVGSGVVSASGALFGGHAVNLAAITAAIMAGPDAHPDRSRRWIAAVSGGVGYLVLGLGAGLATVLVSASPPILITAVAGLALLGALVSALTTALERPDDRIAAIVTFLVVASGVVIAGVGSAFWGLLVGALALSWLRPRRR